MMTEETISSRAGAKSDTDINVKSDDVDSVDGDDEDVVAIEATTTVAESQTEFAAWTCSIKFHMTIIVAKSP